MSQISPAVRNLFSMTTLNAIAILILNQKIPIWPQIDNLAGIKVIGEGSTKDFYTNSLIQSPRIISILVIKSISIFLNLDPAVALFLLGTIIAIVGPPIFIVATQRLLSEKEWDSIHWKLILPTFAFFLLLNSNHLHIFEVNGFYINPFLQGATTANISILFFLFGVLINNKKIKIFLYILSILLHITSGIFLLIIFNNLFLKSFFTSKKRKQALISLSLCISIAAIAILIIFPSYKSGFTYYVNVRSANHYVLLLKNQEIFQVLVWMSFVLLTIVRLNRQSTKLATWIYFCTGTFLIFAAYPFYSLPFFLASLSLMISRNDSGVKTLTNALLILFGFQSFPLVEISTLFSLFLPASRFVSYVCLFHICLLFLYFLRISGTRTGKVQVNLNNKVNIFVAFISIITMTMSCKYLSEDLIEKSQIIRENSTNKYLIKSLNNFDILPIDIDTQGWREAYEVSIYVDSYPFWSNLDEYERRNKFKSDVESLIISSEASLQSLNSLFNQYKINEPLQLIISEQEDEIMRLPECKRVRSFVICDLDGNV